MRRWTEEEINLLVNNKNLRPKDIVLLLVDRTRNAVVNKMRELDISRYPFDPVKRFYRNIEIQENTCWKWLGPKDCQGYGRWRVNGIYCQVHRWSYEYFNFTIIPSDLVCHHICYNKSCVNPTHLEPRTNLENIHDKDSKSLTLKNKLKTHCKYGHEFTEKNTYISIRGGRSCKECHKLNQRIITNYKGNLPNKERTHCPKGHEYNKENTKIKNGSRSCRRCELDRRRESGIKPMNYWDSGLLDFLKENYNKLSKKELINSLNRTWSGIEHKALKLGLRRK